ncbi:NADH-ubiquinone oxidoreductase-related protein [Asticcacaulis excentricus]|uniref:NADH-ubiquinone oxidoreductase-related protein n=2 Tax=Asticcacaulis excentricus TaxID=78587 RepID=A0A3G9G4E2_9CAUL|nr:NADH-ubiquinone oxidoreductase-related protein [Asticcacaulis excentricus]
MPKSGFVVTDLDHPDIESGQISRPQEIVMFARIFKPSKTAMQSGKAKTQDWVLEFEPASARTPDPLMGWISAADTHTQVRLSFDTKEQAMAYAETHGIPFRLIEPETPPKIIKAYADNFASNRRQSWTH